MKRKILVEVIAALLVLLFLYASCSKWYNLKLFTGEMNNQPFPNQLTPWLVWSIPSIELVIAVMIIFEKTRLAGLYASLVLIIIFTIYTISVLLHVFAYKPCSCGGIIPNLSWPQNLAINLFFMAVSVTGILLISGRQTERMRE